MSFAKVTIVGNLGRDPETRYTPSGALNVQFTIAAAGRRRSGGGGGESDQENTTWFQVTAWDRQAERLVTLIERGYIAKGRLLYVDGQLESRQYTDRNGQQRTSLDVTLHDFQFVGSRQDNQGGQAGQGSNYGGGQDNQDTGFTGGQGNQGGYGGGNYGGSNYGSQGGFDNDDEPGNLNDVPF